MAAKRFEDLRIFQQARQLANLVFEFTRSPGFRRDYVLCDQMRRAALSVVSNIAEGFERGSNTEFIQFLFVAKGSCGELRAQALVCADQENCSKEQQEQLTQACLRVSGGILNLIQYLKRSSMKKRSQP